MARIKNIRKNEDGIEIGDQVKHPKFGTGTVLYKSGSGDKAKAIVVFAEEGQKKLLLKYANLKKVKEPKPEETEGELSEEEIVQALDDSVESDDEEDEDFEDEFEEDFEDDSEEVIEKKTKDIDED